MKKNKNENYLEKIPVKTNIPFEQDEEGIITLEVENRGAMNKIAQLIFKKPKVSFIHLDEFGSFVFLQIDGERDIIKIGEAVKDRFGEKAEPLYERLSQYIKTLEKYGFAHITNKGR